ncbi:uncharacterized protein BDZ99DRAFT_513837 [Mytilinidion resinicola]|uniref:Uncharacterized protein n=1 Tax=Mytilinidion resinicola TaxID=574789 RepID=A0A6A6ZBC0_9PEZI|nr:uncharacterized protein BDZ99DRAFT_513837 [Mytilinidion resinicola]KAF2817604.1 hypothetical protein BDZ99DRAFT_513837 [Mytilinidion resinicola]
MPPSSNRKLRSRREPDPQPPSDADTPESISTPSRKRRRLNNGAERTPALVEDAPRARDTDSPQSDDSNRTLSNGLDADNPMDPVEKQNTLIAHLAVPKDYLPNAAVHYNNDLQARRNPGTTPAFAKIAARDWCYFVNKMTILIGRVEKTHNPPPAESKDDPTPAPPNDGTDMPNQWQIDIDLGPERQVSRVHASIDYESEKQSWYINVSSRNGLKLDDRMLGRGEKALLHSGICISLMGTQMLFLLPNAKDEFHPMLHRQVRLGHEHEDFDGGRRAARQQQPPSSHHPSSPKREPFNPFPPASHPRNQQHSYHSSQLTSTPGRGQLSTPVAPRSGGKEPRSRPSPSAYPKGIMLDSMEEIDYSLDSSKDIKPPHSYAQLIGQAILTSPEEMLTLANIYAFIKERYAFFRHSTGGWQNSIRHNLSLAKSFEKVARRTDEPGKGMKWRIADEYRDDFVKKTLFSTRKGQARMDSSGPNSPAIKESGSTHATERLMGAINQSDGIIPFPKHEIGAARVKTPPRSQTPPLASYPTTNDSYTPDRGPNLQTFGGNHPNTSNGAHMHTTPNPKRDSPALDQDARAKSGEGSKTVKNPASRQDASSKTRGLNEAAANSPPTLYSDSVANGGADLGRPGNAGLVTPLVARHAPRLAPPSTAQVPSQYINFSSPAAFWKYLPSTPAGAPNIDTSPIKMKKPNEAAEGADEESAQPSSPPVMFDDKDKNDEDEDDDNEGDGDDGEEDIEMNSPSRTLSRPVSRRDGARDRISEPITAVPNGVRNSNGMVRGASLAILDDDDTEGIDLTKGFQKIGSFHRNMAQQNQGVIRAP